MVTIVSIFLAILPFLFPIISPWSHYNVRVLTFIIPVIIGCIYGSSHQKWFFEFNDIQKMLLAIFTISTMSYHLQVGFQWARYLDHFEDDISMGPSFTSYRMSSLEYSVDPELNQYNTSWAMPTMSVVLGALRFKEIRGIILNEESIQWEPFNPRNVESRSYKLKRFGVSRK